MDRQKAIDYIESRVGYFEVPWHTIPTEFIKALYIELCTHKGENMLMINDAERVGISLR